MESDVSLRSLDGATTIRSMVRNVVSRALRDPLVMSCRSVVPVYYFNMDTFAWFHTIAYIWDYEIVF